MKNTIISHSVMPFISYWRLGETGKQYYRDRELRNTFCYKYSVIYVQISFNVDCNDHLPYAWYV